MMGILDHPDIWMAERTGYGPHYQDDSEPLYLTDEGAMSEDEAVEYMQDYCRTNPRDAAAAFGIEVVG